MDFEIRNQIRSDNYLYSYLREDSYQYKYLYRDKKYIKKINELTRKKYHITNIDKLEKLNNTLNLINTFIDMV